MNYHIFLFKKKKSKPVFLKIGSILDKKWIKIKLTKNVNVRGYICYNTFCYITLEFIAEGNQAKYPSVQINIILTILQEIWFGYKEKKKYE